MQYRIIDFHTHPFLSAPYSICQHQAFCALTAERTLKTMDGLGIEKFCGSVIRRGELAEGESWWDRVRECNDQALALKALYGDRYIMGFHIHPFFVQESLAEIDAMHARGVRLIGELVPYLMGYKSTRVDGFDEIVNYAAKKDMILNIHNEEDLDGLLEAHNDLPIVGAHPSEGAVLMKHIQRLKKHENYYLDISGSGLFREGCLRRLIDEVGADRILFGTDYPVCNPAAYVGGVALDDLLSEKEKQAIFYGNAKKLLNL